MPRIEVHERHEEVKTDGRRGGDDQIGEDIVADLLWLTRIPQLRDDNVYGCKSCVCHDDAVSRHTRQEHFLGSLWSVTHGENELHADEKHNSVS